MSQIYTWTIKCKKIPTIYVYLFDESDIIYESKQNPFAFRKEEFQATTKNKIIN